MPLGLVFDCCFAVREWVATTHDREQRNTALANASDCASQRHNVNANGFV